MNATNCLIPLILFISTMNRIKLSLIICDDDNLNK